MALFCQCEMCKEITRKRKYPLCPYCEKHHDGRLACPEMVNLSRSKKPQDTIPPCKYCGKNHDERLHCKEYVAAKMRTKKETYQTIDPKSCEYYIDLENGKYTVFQRMYNGQYQFEALRYGEPWQDLTGNNLIFYLMVDLIEAKEEIKRLNNELSLDEWEREV